MAQRTDQLRLGAFLYPGGHHIAAWRHPDTQANAGIDFRHYVTLARAAEAAKFDLIFLADGVGRAMLNEMPSSASALAPGYVLSTRSNVMCGGRSGNAVRCVTMLALRKAAGRAPGPGFKTPGSPSLDTCSG